MSKEEIKAELHKVKMAIGENQNLAREAARPYNEAIALLKVQRMDLEHRLYEINRGVKFGEECYIDGKLSKLIRLDGIFAKAALIRKDGQPANKEFTVYAHSKIEPILIS